MKGKRILITGGAGFIGSHLVDWLGNRNEVTTIDDLSTGTLRNLSVAPRTVRLKKASVLQSELLPEVMDGQDVVVRHRHLVGGITGDAGLPGAQRQLHDG